MFGAAPCPHCGTLLWFLNLHKGVCLINPEELSDVKQKLIEILISHPELSDSLDIVELAMELEEFGMVIPEGELKKIKTFDDLIDYILHLPD